MVASITRFAPVAVLLLLPCTLRAGAIPLNGPDGPSAFAADNQVQPDDATHAFDTCDSKAPAWEVSGSLLFLQPSSGNMVYATVINPYPLLTPHWSDVSVRPDFSPAFNVGMRYLFDGVGDAQVNWTHLNAFDGASYVSAVPLPPVPGIPPLSGPSNTQALGPPFLIGTPPPFASASTVAHFAYDAVNLDAGLFLSAAPHVQLRAFAGLQVARINQSLTTAFLSSNRAIGFIDDSRSLFTGAGPRLGMDVHYLAGRFDLLGQIAGATVIGNRQSRIDFFTSSPQTAAAGLPINAQSLTAPDATQVVPCIDARLGGSYAIPVGRFGILKCEAGYQAAVYVNAINQYSLTEVENKTVIMTEGTAATFLRTAVELQSNFLVHGPYLRFSFQF